MTFLLHEGKLNIALNVYNISIIYTYIPKNKKTLHLAFRCNKTVKCYCDRKSLLCCFYTVKVQIENRVTYKLKNADTLHRTMF